jgi:hypothetical protein
MLVVHMKITVFWDITAYSPLKVKQRFRGAFRLHLHGQRISKARNQRESRWQIGLFDPEDGDDMLLRTAG